MLWKDIKGYEGKYQVSNQGHIKRLKRKTYNAGLKGKSNFFIIKPRTSLGYIATKGYLRTTLYRDGKKKSYPVHRLVLETFHPEPNMKKLQVNHKDCNKTNNHLSNLEWVTCKENIAHAIKHGKHVLNPYVPPKKLTMKQAEKIRGIWTAGKHSQTQIGRMFNISQCTVSKVINRNIYI